LYQKKYGTEENKEFAEYLKLKSSYMGLGKENRQQKLLIDTTEDAENFAYSYEKSGFKPFVVNIIENMRLGLKTLNINISQLYDRVDKPKASAFYKEKAEADILGE
jgi:outer membrane protein assembly factor BamD